MAKIEKISFDQYVVSANKTSLCVLLSLDEIHGSIWSVYNDDASDDFEPLCKWRNKQQAIDYAVEYVDGKLDERLKSTSC